MPPSVMLRLASPASAGDSAHSVAHLDMQAATRPASPTASPPAPGEAVPFRAAEQRPAQSRQELGLGFIVQYLWRGKCRSRTELQGLTGIAAEEQRKTNDKTQGQEHNKLQGRGRGKERGGVLTVRGTQADKCSRH